ncbi:MAG: hypothetical protein JWO32_1039 [Bacteroidetes bacterium]|nr:hypothetical protein [Bacteroidota bacterium]
MDIFSHLTGAFTLKTGFKFWLKKWDNVITSNIGIRKHQVLKIQTFISRKEYKKSKNE